MTGKVKDFMERYGMTQPGDRLIAGLSGGADSVCLLYVLNQLREELKIELFAVHIHHGLRGAEADRDAEFAQRMCRQMDIPCFVLYKDVKTCAAKGGISTEEAGRILRYEGLREEKERLGAQKLALAHHRDDSAETILHHLFRGTGLKGLSGITPVRGDLIRPLLAVGRGEILDFLHAYDLKYCEDSTNLENDYTRNRIRNHILPLAVKEVNPGAVDNILRAGDMVGEADRYFEQLAASILERQVCTPQKGCVSVPVSVFAGQPGIVRAYLIRALIGMAGGSLRDLGFSHIDKVRQLIDKPVGKYLDLPGGLRAVKGYETLSLTEENAEPRGPGMQAEMADLFEFLVLPAEKDKQFPKNQYTKWFDYDKIKGTLSARFRLTGDYISLAGGGRKTVKSFMIDEKIPAARRKRIPLVADGSHILWIVGYRISEYYKITEETAQILQIRYVGGTTHGGTDQGPIV